MKLKLLNIETIKSERVHVLDEEAGEDGYYLRHEMPSMKRALWFKPSFRAGENGFDLVTDDELDAALEAVYASNLIRH